MNNFPAILVPLPIPIEVPIKTTRQKREPIPYSEFKSDGKPKAQAADSIRSYDEFNLIQKYFYDRGKIRNWMMWVIGVSFGVRISDLSKLKIGHLLNDDHSFKQRVKIIEQKTCKLNNILITDSVKDALAIYLDSLNWQFSLDDYLFISTRTKLGIDTRSGWRILSDAGKALNLPINMGSHTMRKSFINIVASTNKSKIDMNAIVTAQYLLNHSDQRTTMKYLSVFEKVSDSSRIAVSDFVLGKSSVNELMPIVYDDKAQIQDIIALLKDIKVN